VWERANTAVMLFALAERIVTFVGVSHEVPVSLHHIPLQSIPPEDAIKEVERHRRRDASYR
jgi:hypothetical protein